MPRVAITARRRSKREVHSDDTEIEQRRTPANAAERDEGDVIQVDRIGAKDYLAELAFMEEPVRIRLEPSTDKNAICKFVVYVNGQGAEILLNGKWLSIGWLPVGQEITVKRKVLEVIVRTKIDTIHTEVRNKDSDQPFNTEQRFTSAVHSFSVIEDKSPRGAAWLSEMRRRNW
jgi:hypothetical protein